ncbi:hypothetical protein [Sphingopyxis sp. YR583]|nr:hypothetical protein [Sphingopyxis sp. YR583]
MRKFGRQAPEMERFALTGAEKAFQDSVHTRQQSKSQAFAGAAM